MIFRKCLLVLNNEEMAMCAMRDVFVDFLEDRNRFDIEYPSESFTEPRKGYAVNIPLEIVMRFTKKNPR
jgi:hypothetical protein